LGACNWHDYCSFEGIAEFEPSARHGYKRQGHFSPSAVAFIFSELGIQMSTLHNRLAEVASTRLSVVTGAAANLVAQLAELNELRERVRKAQLSARGSRRTRHRTRARI
jgi:hypothetical protein